MPTTSQDILNVTLSIAVTILTIFLCLVFAYMLVAFRDVLHLIRSTRKRVDAAWKYFERMKDKTESAALTTAAITKAVIQVVGYVKKRKNTREKKHKSDDEQNSKT